MHSKDTLIYKCRGNQNIGISVLGMINDNVGISECGMDFVVKNAIINSFLEAQRLEMHTDKAWLLTLVAQPSVTNPALNLKCIKTKCQKSNK